MNFNSQFNTNKPATQIAPNKLPAFLGTNKGVLLMNGDYEPKFVKLLCDYVDHKESDKTFNAKFVKLSKNYFREEKPVTYPDWFKNLVAAFSKINNKDFDAILSRSAISTADFKVLVFKVLQDFKNQNKHLDIITKDYSKYINLLDIDG